jgi:molybdopterin molybdotransferase
MEAIADLWKRIAKWYRRHAPPEALSLGRPATSKEIALVESILDVKFPRGVWESYRIHNGSNDTWVFEYSGYYLSLKDIVQSWAILLPLAENPEYRELRTSPQGPIKENVWNKRWIPVTGSGSGDHLCIDLDPASGGALGQVIEYSHEEGPKRCVANSFGEWLTKFVGQLESN